MTAARQWPAVLAALPLVAGAVLLGAGQGGRQAALWGLGAALGVALYQATFSFAGAFRDALAQRRGVRLRAQMLLLALLVLLMMPAIEAGSLFGEPVRGLVFPAGVAVLVGAFVFGIGMQLGGGCASGTLYTAGGGNSRMVLTLVFFIGGATLAAWDSERWSALPALPATSLPDLLGLWPAIGVSLGVFALVAWASIAIERRRHGMAEALAWGGGHAWRGSWPLPWGAVALALLSVATLVLAGRPWVITAAFPLWGSRAVEALGWDDPAFWGWIQHP